MRALRFSMPQPLAAHLLHLLWLLSLFVPSLSPGADLGFFENQADVGAVAKAGTAIFQASDTSYLISGGGENMWFTNDAFHFVYSRWPL